MSRPATIYVDADACPVREEIYSCAARNGLKTVVVTNSGLRPVRGLDVQIVTVSSGFDAADDWIVAHIDAGDICVTGDVPLASRCVDKNAVALSPSGRVFDDASTGAALAARDLNQHLREANQIQTYNRPFTARQRSEFAQALERMIRKTGSKQAESLLRKK